jgi:hypothetical protein
MKRRSGFAPRRRGDAENKPKIYRGLTRMNADQEKLKPNR